MRNRTVGINIRVTENEKKKLSRNARKRHLSLSEYLRNRRGEQGIFQVVYKKKKFRNHKISELFWWR